jgi:hypothetical protein
LELFFMDGNDEDVTYSQEIKVVVGNAERRYKIVLNSKVLMTLGVQAIAAVHGEPGDGCLLISGAVCMRFPAEVIADLGVEAGVIVDLSEKCPTYCFEFAALQAFCNLLKNSESMPSLDVVPEVHALCQSFGIYGRRPLVQEEIRGLRQTLREKLFPPVSVASGLGADVECRFVSTAGSPENVVAAWGTICGEARVALERGVPADQVLSYLLKVEGVLEAIPVKQLPRFPLDHYDPTSEERMLFTRDVSVRIVGREDIDGKLLRSLFVPPTTGRNVRILITDDVGLRRHSAAGQAGAGGQAGAREATAAEATAEEATAAEATAAEATAELVAAEGTTGEEADAVLSLTLPCNGGSVPLFMIGEWTAELALKMHAGDSVAVVELVMCHAEEAERGFVAGLDRQGLSADDTRVVRIYAAAKGAYAELTRDHPIRGTDGKWHFVRLITESRGGLRGRWGEGKGRLGSCATPWRRIDWW